MTAQQEAVTVIKLDTSSVPPEAAKASRAIGGIAQSAQVSAAQTRNAMRQLPAQFTDIATQIAGGQNIGLILLQQGGQIRDSFGSIRGALAGIASVLPASRVAMLGAAGAATALAAAYAAASREQDGIVRALVLSGNAAGVTANQLNDLAIAQDALAGTRNQAASVLTTLAASGAVTSAQLAGATDAAIRLQRAGGPAIDETVRKFIALGRDPLQALIQLNKEENFLTESLYRQVRALEDQGRRFEAAAVAQDAYTSVTLSRTAALETQLGSIQRLWRGIKDLAGEAWDAMLNIGRPDTLQQQLDAAIRQLEAAGTEARRGTDPRQGEARRAAIRQRIEDLRLQIYLEGEAAAASQAEAQRVKRVVDDEEAARRRRPPARREDAPFVGPPTFSEQFGTRLADLVSNDAQAKADAYATTLRQLDELYFSGVIGVSAYEGAVAKLTGAKAGGAAAASEWLDAERRLVALLEGTPGQVLEKQRADMLLLADAFERGRVTEEQYLEAVGKRLNLQDTVVDDVASRARQNIQDSFGDIFTRVFEGQFDNIGDLFGQLLRRMVAEAAAADLVYWLFGKGQGGNLTGLLGGIFGAFGNLFGGPRASGGDVQPGRAYLVGERGPEMLLMGGRAGHILSNAELMAAGAGGGGFAMHMTQYIDARADAAQLAQTQAHAIRTAQEGMWQQMRARGLA